MTKKENFATIKGILNGIGNMEFDAFLDHEIELVSRKRSASSKPTKRQIENEGVKNDIYQILIDSDEKMTVTEILSRLEDSTITNQRVSALLRQMVNDEKKVIKEVVKGKSYFSVA